MGSSKKTTVGYRYYIGMHNVLCHGPIDAITEIRCGEKVAYKPFVFNPITLNISATGLFGGDSREGGVSGNMDLLFGGPNQLQNAYLQSQLGTDIPAFRGVASVVWNQFYMGNNPYLKAWDFKAQRVYVRQDGIDQWYPEYAGIGSLVGEDIAIHFALDFSTSMDTTASNGQQKYENLQEAFGIAMDFVKQLIAGGSIQNISIQCKLFTDEGFIVRNNCTQTDIDDIKTYVNAQSPGAFTGTSFEDGFEDAPGFFTANAGYTPIMILITDGGTTTTDADAAAAYRDQVADNLTYGVQLDDPDTTATQIVAKDNDVPVIDSGNTGYVAGLITQFISGHLDMNPAHIIRECLTDPDWGMGYAEADMDDTEFEAAADQLFAENMGMSLLWDRQIEIEDFISEVLSHIDANLYVSRSTGKFVLKLIRDDYDEGTLITLNEDNIKSVKNYQRINPLEAVNTVVVNYWDHMTGETSSVSADNLALIQESGTINATTINYDGFTNSVLAGRVAARDLKSLSSPLLSCDIVCDRSAADLNIGDVFKFEWPDYHTGFIVMRVADIKFGKNDDAAVKIKCTQDVFSLPSASRVGQEDDGWTDPSAAPVPADYNVAEEGTYFDLAQEVGDAQAQETLNLEPDAGYVKGTSNVINNGINGVMSVDSGTGYSDVGIYDFVPTATLDADVGYLDATFTVTFNDLAAMDEVTIESYALIDTEYVAVTAIDTVGGTISVKRGILDTPPEKHTAGANIAFVQDFYTSDPTQYLLSESIDVQLRPTTSLGTLDLGEAPIQNVVMASRANRPYPPGDVEFNGVNYIETQIPVNTDVVLTWASRNRLQQTGASFVDFIDGDITPEANTTYRVVITDNDSSTQLADVTGIIPQTYTMLYNDYPTVANFKFELFSERDGYESLRAVEHVVNVYRELLITSAFNVATFVKEPLALLTSSMNVASFMKGSTLTTSSANIISFVKGKDLTTTSATVVTFVKAP